jgi:hypothetical protein
MCYHPPDDPRFDLDDLLVGLLVGIILVSLFIK